MLKGIKKRISGSIKKRLYLLTGVVGIIMLMMVLAFVWAGNTLTMITAIARFERTHTISRVEAIHFFTEYYYEKNPAFLDLFREKWAITQSYNQVFGSLLEMRTTKSVEDFADILDKTFAEADRKTSRILVNRIHLLYWHPLIIKLVDIAQKAHEQGLLVDAQVRIILGSDNESKKNAAFVNIEKIEQNFRILENDFSNTTGMFGTEIAFIIKLLSTGMLILSVGLTGFLSIITIRSISIPIKQFISYSKNVAGGNTDAEKPEMSDDELLSLSDSIFILLNLNQRLKNEVDEKTQIAQKLSEANRQITESELKQSTMISNISDVIGIVGTDGVLKYISPNIEKWFGWKPCEVIGTIGLSRVHPDDYERIRSVFDSLSEKTGSSHRVEYRYQCKNGSYKPIELTANNLSDNPFINGVLLNYQDITQRLQVEEKLKESEALYTMTLDALNDGLWDWNVQTGDMFFSPRYYMMLGYGDEALFNDYASWKKLICHEDSDRVEQELLHAIDTGTGFRIDLRMTMPSGEWRWFCTRGKTIVKDTDGKALRIVGTLSDITEQKLIEEEAMNLQNQLAQTQKIESIGRLAGGVAHDVNNMLSIMMGYAEMTLESLPDPDPLRMNIQEIISAGRRSTSVVRQLLAFARKQTIMPKILNLNDTIADILTMLKRLIGEDIDLRWKPAETVWPVKMDPSQLDQLLANLTVNARDAITDVGKVTIETGNVTFDQAYCEAHEGFKPGDFVMVTVSDNGIGMDKETLVNIFEPFFTTKDLGKGTGLGLSTVYGIIKQNNGFINVYSEPGQGSTFRVYVPRCHLVTDEFPEKTQSSSLPTGDETILLVEDEPSILNLGKAMLERLGYTVLAANTPNDAIRLAQEFDGEIKLLMTDVVMPEMNGRDLTRQILSAYPRLKVLFMSGYTANVIAHHGVLDEGVQFIHKPFSKKDLANKVREALDID